MKVHLIFLIILLNTFCVLSQNVIGEISYKVTKNYSTSGVSYSKLHFNINESLFESGLQNPALKKSTKYTETKQNEKGTQTNLYTYSKNKDTDFYYYSNKDFFFREVYIDNSFYVKDTFNLKWELEVGLKNIAGFECNKASVFFRGRKYNVWYTIDIPYNYGPWKFHGLPGLILEIIEEQGVLKIEAFKIKINNTSNKINLRPKIQSEQISFKTFNSKKQKLLDIERRIFQSKLPKSMKVSQNCEECNIKLEIID